MVAARASRKLDRCLSLAIGNRLGSCFPPARARVDTREEQPIQPVLVRHWLRHTDHNQVISESWSITCARWSLAVRGVLLAAPARHRRRIGVLGW